MGAGDPVLVRAMACDVKLEDVKNAAHAMANERDVLGRPEQEPSFGVDGLLDKIKAAVNTLDKLKASCVDKDDDAHQSALDLEADLLRAERLDPMSRERFLRRLTVVAHRGQQGNWKPKDACKQAKAELKAVKDAQAEWRAASDAHVAWSVRDRLRGFLDAYESAKKEAAVVDFQDLLLRTRDCSHPLAERAPLLPAALRLHPGRRAPGHRPSPGRDRVPARRGPDRTGRPPTGRSVRLAPGKLFLVGDPKQSIYRFRRADIALYQQAKRLVERSGGEVLPLDTSFRTVPSIVGFVNELFDGVFRTDPEVDPNPLPLAAYRSEVDRGGARTVALPIPAERLPEDGDRRVGTLGPIVADTIAAFIEEITERRPWSIRDGDTVRAVRPGDVALLVRKATPDFLAPVERALEVHDVPFRIVGGKQYYVRDEVRALGAVLRAIDNPADRLAVFAALRSPFFAFSDDDLWQLVASGGTLGYQAPIPESARNATLVAPAFDTLRSLHRLRRVHPPSEVIVALLERTRALAGFRLRPGGDQLVANLWKTLDLARAYEAAGPTTLREVVRFLEAEAAKPGGDEGDSPVGDEAGKQVAVLTIHSAKGLEYPIVVLGDILSGRGPTRQVVIDHAARQGWLKIGSIKPAGLGRRRRAREAPGGRRRAPSPLCGPHPGQGPPGRPLPPRRTEELDRSPSPPPSRRPRGTRDRLRHAIAATRRTANGCGVGGGRDRRRRGRGRSSGCCRKDLVRKTARAARPSRSTTTRTNHRRQPTSAKPPPPSAASSTSSWPHPDSPTSPPSKPPPSPSAAASASPSPTHAKPPPSPSAPASSRPSPPPPRPTSSTASSPSLAASTASSSPAASTSPTAAPAPGPSSTSRPPASRAPPKRKPATAHSSRPTAAPSANSRASRCRRPSASSAPASWSRDSPDAARRGGVVSAGLTGEWSGWRRGRTLLAPRRRATTGRMTGGERRAQ